MNKRFKQIAEEVFFDESTTGKPGQKMYMFGELKMQKFAELIVRECIDICYNHPARIPSNNWQGVTVPLDIAQRLKEHFGVEE